MAKKRDFKILADGKKQSDGNTYAIHLCQGVINVKICGQPIKQRMVEQKESPPLWCYKCYNDKHPKCTCTEDPEDGACDYCLELHKSYMMKGVPSKK